MMAGQKGAYKYTECGLSSVTLKDILVYRCANCGAVVPEIPAAGLLHRLIAWRLVCKKKLLTGGEARFLRKLFGYSVNEFAEILGSNKSVVSRWERDGYGPDTERVVRFLVVAKLTRELVGVPTPILRNVTVERLLGDLEDTLKLLDENKNRSSENYEISPEEIAKFSSASEELNEPDAVLQ
jgi:transcriptional regulator with XRE-family HTH domain